MGSVSRTYLDSAISKANLVNDILEMQPTDEEYFQNNLTDVKKENSRMSFKDLESVRFNIND